MANYRYCIYCHTNKVTGMKYVGCTRLNPLHRWGKNGTGYDTNNLFGKDIQKYGWDNFTHEILEYGIIGRKNADEAERKYIKLLNAIYPNGYNSEDGGIHGSVNPQETKEKRPRKGWHHSEETKKKMSEAQKKCNKPSKYPSRSKPIDMLAKDGKFIRTFYGASEASREMGISLSTICKMCKDTKGRYKSVGGYIWKYHND